MPEYLAPGVYVEETSFRAKSIEGVSTSTAAFVGPTRYGPVDGEPALVTSLIEFERTYGDRQRLDFTAGQGDPTHNYMWHAARAFFDNGGRRLYVQRIFLAAANDEGEGRASARVPITSPGARPEDMITVLARFPGAAGNRRVRLTLVVGDNVLTGSEDEPAVTTLQDRDVVWISDVETSPPHSPASPPRTGALAMATRDTDTGEWSFERLPGNPPVSPPSIGLDELRPDPDPERSDEIRVVTLTVTVYPTEEGVLPQVWAGLPLDPAHARLGIADSVFDRFALHPDNRDLSLTLPLVIEHADGIDTGLDVLDALLKHEDGLLERLEDEISSDDDRSIDLVLSGGDDGARPGLSEYEGGEVPGTTLKTGLLALEDIDEISIVAAPGSTFDYESEAYRSTAASIVGKLINHAERMRYRIAVVDAGNAQTLAQAQRLRGRFDSSYAAFYYPWVRVVDPVTTREIDLPPSGHVAGIYARNDVTRAVYKAPANEVVAGAIGFELLVNTAQQEVLNPRGVNCLRFFEGRGYRIWGARTMSSDPEWKYVNLRRYFIYLEHSIDRGTQWAVFEPNGERLWANVRRTIEDFLLTEWMNGALLGDKPEKAYFVKCDRTTMTQNDLDNGRLVCLIGVAPLRPAEFVIFRIGQWTADRR
jgi:phage tail sheath protein FI